jgi:hypothetical protein
VISEVRLFISYTEVTFMSEFANKNLNCNDYHALNQDWAKQLEQLGWQRTWTEDGPGWRSPSGGEGQSTYDAWAEATETPTDLKYGLEKEPPTTPYRKPV